MIPPINLRETTSARIIPVTFRPSGKCRDVVGTPGEKKNTRVIFVDKRLLRGETCQAKRGRETIYKPERWLISLVQHYKVLFRF